MDRMIFVNLPVADLAVSNAFYTGLGFRINPDFSDDKATCVKVFDKIYLMLLVRERFADFVVGEVGDPAKDTQVLLCLSAESRAEVDELVTSALAHGGKPWLPVQEHGPMYGHSFADPDGHVLEIMHMDLPAATTAC
ncbi:MAG TPA: VOC family protein [Pseudonocardia sp.]|uniref:VOC family protein n=1 Tax=Pseudonocardia sp. TaxID=60912 RepID=UPI002F4206E8